MKVSPAEYHTWAQHSLNRVPEVSPKINVNGVSHESYPEYKLAVRRFQEMFVGKTSGVVDETTQNLLIKNNHINEGYNKWIRESLYKISGNQQLIQGSGQDKDLAQAIKQYQRSKTKAELNDDGWVGCKTEICLAMEASLPFPAPPPKGLPKASLEDVVRRTLGYLEEDLEKGNMPMTLPYQAGKGWDDRSTFRRFVEKVATPGLDDAYFDPQTAKDYLRGWDKNNNSPGIPGLPSPSHAFAAICNKVRYNLQPQYSDVYKTFIWWTWETFLDVEHGLCQTIFEAKNYSADGVIFGRGKAMVDWTEAKKNKFNSILSCWPQWKSWSGTPWWIS